MQKWFVIVIAARLSKKTVTVTLYEETKQYPFLGGYSQKVASKHIKGKLSKKKNCA